MTTHPWPDPTPSHPDPSHVPSESPEQLPPSLWIEQLAEMAGDPISDPPPAFLDHLATVCVPPLAQSAWPEVAGYVLLGELGRGGMGIVYKALHLALDRGVALKMILAESQGKDADVDRFHVEAQAIARLQHPHIVELYEFGEQDGRTYFTMELCPGGSLAERLRGAVLTPRVAARITEQLARAVAFAHDRGILHRDLKPSNVLLMEGPETPLDRCTPKIGDFGIAKRLDEADGPTRTGAIMGTPGFMSPEQALGERGTVGPAADIYGLGATLYHLLTGRPPFQGPTPYETTFQVLHDDPLSPRKLVPGTPRDLEIICLKCLHKDPGRRYLQAADLADDLQRFQAGEPIRARPVSVGERLIRWCWRRPALAAAIIVTVLSFVVIVGLGAAYLHRGWQAENAQRLQAEANAYETQLAAARDAGKNGDWPSALDLYQRLLERPDCPDRRRLEAERLPGFLAVQQPARFLAELNSLVECDDLGTAAPLVQLLQAEVAFCRRAERDQARQKIREALQAEDQLPPGERKYGEALASEQPREFITLLEKAVDEAPFHHRANRALLMARVARGEFDLARRQAEIMRRRFPFDPLADFAEAYTELIQNGNRQACFARLEPFLAKQDEPQRQQIQQYLTGLADLLESWNKLDPGLGAPEDQQGLLQEWRKVRRQTELFRELADPTLETLVFAVPTADLLFDALQPVADNILAVNFGPATLGPLAYFTNEWVRRPALVRLDQASQDYPEALILTTAASIRGQRVGEMLMRDDLEACRVELKTLIDLCQRAAIAPTLAPRSPFRYQSRIISVVADIALLKEAGDPIPGQLDRLKDNVDRLVREGRPFPDVRKQGLAYLVQMLSSRPTKRMMDAWGLDRPEAAARYQERKQLFCDLGRRVVTEWQRDQPDCWQAWSSCASLENWTGNYQEALRSAQRAVALAVTDKEKADAADHEKTAREGLKKLANMP